MIGKTVSHYRIEEKLGEGGMGVVYRADDLKLHRTVALKFFRPDAVHGGEWKARFLTEAEAAAALTHPNVCIVYEIEEGGESPFIAMEYVAGESLAGRLRKGPLPTEDALAIATQIAKGLQAAHKKGIVHRDIKPANIMVDTEGRVKITDFGLAHLDRATQITRTGTVLGTPSYMSPEQVEGQRVDHRSDIWSLGVVLYEMVKGGPPFEGDSQRAVMYAIAQKEPAGLDDSKLDQSIKRMLHKSVEERYQTVEELLDELATVESLEASGVAQPGAVVSRRLRPKLLAGVLTVGLVAAGFIGWLLNRQAKVRWARYEAAPEIMRLADNRQFAAALRLAEEAESYYPNNPALTELLPAFSREVDIVTEPAEAEVFTRPYAASDVEWRPVGITPIDSLRLPKGRPELLIRKAGFRDVRLVSAPVSTVVLDPIDASPEGMLRVRGGNRMRVQIADLTHLTAALDDFFVDQYEVTNGEYAEFVAAGGYERPEFWKSEFVKDGNRLSWEEAMKLFLDETGRPGPSTWSLGAYPEGQKDYPVSGVSWYEAAAYAEYAGKSLPTVYQWSRAATPWLADKIPQHSNFGNAGPAPAGKFPGISGAGCYDVAGNVKEWCWNEIGPKAGKRAILGGAWNEPDYTFAAPDARDPFVRSETFGFRCVRAIEGTSLPEKLRARLELLQRDYAREKPVGDEVFQILHRFYDYDPQPLGEQVEAVDDRSVYWRKETISFNAAYGGERVTAYMFLPKEATPPYQPILLYPGAGSLRARSSAQLRDMASVEFIVRSGRAVIYPVYKSTYERADGYFDARPSESSSYREHVIQWFKDAARAVDYLSTREDTDLGKLGYYGLSWGAAMGPIVLGLDSRYRAGVLVVGGFWQQKAAPEADQINHAPRVSAPVLMLNGSYDSIFPVHTSQEPMFRLLGTPAEDKRHVTFESGHSIPRNEHIRHTLNWFDKYLGPPAK